MSSAVLEPARDGVRNVLPALKQIELLASLPPVAAELELGKSDFLIEQDRDAQN